MIGWLEFRSVLFRFVNSGSGFTGSCGARLGCAEGGAVTSGWHLVTGTYDGSTATLYVDGAMAASDTFAAPGNTTYPLYIGRYYADNGSGWNGAIDEVHLYNRAVTSAEVSRSEERRVGKECRSRWSPY